MRESFVEPQRKSLSTRRQCELLELNRFVIDDLSYIPQEREETDVLFLLLAERYERRSVVITSNLPFSKWDSVFKDPMTAMAAVDRLVHHSTILELMARVTVQRRRQRSGRRRQRKSEKAQF